MPFGLGIWEIVILAVILLLLFGGKGLPGMARKLGSSVREVKDAVEEMDPRSLFDDEKKPEPKQLADAEVVRPVAPASAGRVAAEPVPAEQPGQGPPSEPATPPSQG